MPRKKNEASTPNFDSLSERISALEAYQRTGEIETSMITIRGESGVVRAQITDQGLYLADEDGHLRLAVVTDSDGTPSIDLLNKNMLPCMSLAVLENGLVSMAISGGYNKGRLHLRLTPGGIPRLVLTDAQANERLALSVDTEGRPSLTLLDKDQEGRLDLTTESNGTPGVSLQDSEGRIRAAVVLAHDGTPQVRLDDPEGRPIFIAP